MELRHLRYFVAVAEERNISRAAARLGLQQPPLSSQIRALEAELGVPLFIRLPRGVALNEAGETFLEEARAVLAAADRAATRAVLAARGQRGEITIGVATSAILHPLVPEIIGSYARNYPDVTVRLQEGNAAEMTDGVVNGTLRVAFIRAMVARPAAVTFSELLEEELLVAVSAMHPLARRRSATVHLKELARERFILVRRPNAPGMYADLLDACRAAGFEPEVATEVGRMLTNISLVAAGLGVSLVPASMREIHRAEVRYLRLARSNGLRAPLTVASRAHETDPIAINFLRIARGLAAAWRQKHGRTGRKRARGATPDGKLRKGPTGSS